MNSPFIIKSRKVIWLLLPFLLVFLGIVWWYRSYNHGVSPTQVSPVVPFQANLRLGNLKIQDDPVLAIQFYEAALNEAATPEERVRAQFLLANAYWFSDHMKSVDALKAIVQDTQNPPEYKAAAINLLASIASDGVLTDRILVDHIFTGPGWQTLIDQFKQSSAYTSSTSQLTVYIFGVRLGYEWSERIMPTPEATYALASWYASGAFVAGNPYGPKDIDLAKKYLAQGDALLAAHEKDGFPYPIAITPTSLINKEITRVQLYRLGFDKDMGGIIRESTDLIALSETSPYARNHYNSEFARYILAAALAFSGASPGAIHTVLSPLYASTPSPRFLGSLRIQHNAALTYAPLYNPWSIAIAKADPAFRKLLVGAGWQDADFKG